MNLKDIHIERFHLPFKTDFMNGGVSVSGKDVAILRASCNGLVHEGEIGPFPGVHEESLFDLISTFSFPDSVRIPDFDQWSLHQEKFGLDLPGRGEAIVSAWEQVLFSIYLSIQGFSWEGYLPLAGLLTLGEDAEDTAQTLVSNGFKTIKIKVGRSLIEEEALYLKKVKEVCGSEVKFRLDGNQNLELEQIKKLAAILGEQLEYIEEPFKSIQDNLDLGLPVALDECLWEMKTPFEYNVAPYLVLKPMKVGLSKVFYWVREQGWSTDKIILSSCFDTGVALKHYIKLACFLGLSSAHGFGTYRFFREDILDHPLPLNGGIMPVGGDMWR